MTEVVVLLELSCLSMSLYWLIVVLSAVIFSPNESDEDVYYDNLIQTIEDVPRYMGDRTIPPYRTEDDYILSLKRNLERNAEFHSNSLKLDKSSYRFTGKIALFFAIVSIVSAVLMGNTSEMFFLAANFILLSCLFFVTPVFWCGRNEKNRVELRKRQISLIDSYLSQDREPYPYTASWDEWYPEGDDDDDEDDNDDEDTDSSTSDNIRTCYI